jgi:hypothetical protein
VIEDTLALRFSKVEEVDNGEDDTDTDTDTEDDTEDDTDVSSDAPAPIDASVSSDAPVPNDAPAPTTENIAHPPFINSDRMVHILKTVYMDMKSPTKLDLSIKKPAETQQSDTQQPTDTQTNDTKSNDSSYLDNYLAESEALNSDEGIDSTVNSGDSEVDNYVRNLIKTALRSKADVSYSCYPTSISDIPEDVREDIAKDINIARKILSDVQFANA